MNNSYKYPIEISLFDFIDMEHQNSLWYGGEVATVKYGEYRFYLWANGDVRATLLDEHNDILDEVKDKNNMGEFYGIMRQFIPNDEALSVHLRDLSLVLENNNWWEIFMDAPNGGMIDLGDAAVANSDKLLEVINEIIENIPQYIKWAEEDN